MRPMLIHRRYEAR